MAIMFSAHVSGNFMTPSNASHTPLSGSIHAEKGSRNMYNQATKNAIGHPRNQRIKNHKMPHSIPGHRPPPLPDPSPDPSPNPIAVGYRCLNTKISENTQNKNILNTKARKYRNILSTKTRKYKNILSTKTRK